MLFDPLFRKRERKKEYFIILLKCSSLFQEAEVARKNLYELRSIASAVESSGQKTAEAQVSFHEQHLFKTSFQRSS